MNLEDIKLRVWDRLGEDSTDPLRFTDAILEAFVKEATEQWSIDVGLEVSTQIVTLVNDQLDYTFAETPIRIISVVDVDTDQHLIPITMRELYETQGIGANRRWRNVRSNRPTHYCWFSHDTIRLWPPMSDVGGKTITVTYQHFSDDDIDSVGVETVTVANGGASYAVGNTISLAGGTPIIPAVLTVATELAGVITGVTLTLAGDYTSFPSSPAAGTTLTGVGVGATFNLTSFDTDQPLPLQEYHARLVDYVHGRCLMLSARSEDRINRGMNLVSRWFQAMEQGRSNRSLNKTWQISSREVLK